MTPLELTSAITVIANAIACNLTIDEISYLSAILVQLADTLATITTVKGIREEQRLSE